jgi:hypothetical protein
MTDSAVAVHTEAPTSPESISRAVAEAAGPVPRPAVDLLGRLGEQVGDKASTAAVFGEPIGVDGVTVIPVASVAYGFGGRNAAKTDHARGDEGGGGGTARPIGFIQISDGTAVFKPIRGPLWDLAVPLIALLSATTGRRFSHVLARQVRRRKNVI